MRSKIQTSIGGATAAAAAAAAAAAGVTGGTGLGRTVESGGNSLFFELQGRLADVARKNKNEVVCKYNTDGVTCVSLLPSLDPKFPKVLSYALLHFVVPCLI